MVRAQVIPASFYMLYSDLVLNNSIIVVNEDVLAVRFINKNTMVNHS